MFVELLCGTRGRSGQNLTNRECVAIPLSRIDGMHDGRIVGWQRIYLMVGNSRRARLMPGTLLAAATSLANYVEHAAYALLRVRNGCLCLYGCKEAI